MNKIYLPSGNIIQSYPQLLRSLYDVNDALKRDGIMAPSSASVMNTNKLYELIGRPLDHIPTIHVGGTNGKVFYSLRFQALYFFSSLACKKSFTSAHIV
jgi:folylpolyglutamate synthase/dihydropteroate synthase